MFLNHISFGTNSYECMHGKKIKDKQTFSFNSLSLAFKMASSATVPPSARQQNDASESFPPYPKKAFHVSSSCNLTHAICLFVSARLCSEGEAPQQIVIVLNVIGARFEHQMVSSYLTISVGHVWVLRCSGHMRSAFEKLPVLLKNKNRATKICSPESSGNLIFFRNLFAI